MDVTPSISYSIEIELEKMRRELGTAQDLIKRFAESSERAATRTQAAITRSIEIQLQRQAQAEERRHAQSVKAAQKAADARVKAEEQALKKIQAAREKAMKAVLRGVESVGDKSLMGAATLGAAGVGAMGKAGQFDSAMRNVNSVAQMTEASLAKMNAEVLRMTDDPNIRQGPTNLAEGLYDVVSSGFKGQEAMEVLRDSARGASAGLTSTSISAKGLMAVLNSGIPGVRNSKEAMDNLFQIVNLGVVRFEELAGSIGQVAPTAAMAGVSIQEIGAYLTVATRNGQSASEAVNDLNNLITKIIRPSDEAAKMMRQMGISFGMTALQQKGFSGILGEIITKTKGHQDSLAKLFPDMQAFRGLLTAMKGNATGYKDALKQMGDATSGVGATQRANNEINKGATAQYDKLKQQIERVAIEIGNRLLPSGLKALKWLRDKIEAWRNLSPAVRDNIVQFGLWTTGVLAFVGIASRVVTGIASITTAVNTLNTALATGALRAINFRGALTNLGLAAAAWETSQAMKGVGDDALKRLKEKYNLPKPKTFEEQERERLFAPLNGLELRKKLKDNAKNLFGNSNRGLNFNPLRPADLSQFTIKPSAVDPVTEALRKLNTAGRSSPIFGVGGESKGSKGKSDAERKLEQLKNAAKDAYEELVRLTKGESALKILQANEQYREDSKNPYIGQTKALDLLRLRLAEIYKGINSDRDTKRKEGQQREEEWNRQSLRQEEEFAEERKRLGWSALEEYWKGLRDRELMQQQLTAQKRNRAWEMLNAGFREQGDRNEQVLRSRRIAEETKKEEAALRDWQYQNGILGLNQYMQILRQRYEASKVWGARTAETLKIEQQMWETVLKGGRDAARGIAEGMDSGKNLVRNALSNIAAESLAAMQNTLRKGFGGFFGDILARTLTNLLSDVLENAISSLFKKKGKTPFAGGGISDLFGGLVSPILGFLGFDDAANDSRARGWGFDFAKHFERGAQSYQAQRERVTPVASRSAQPVQITVDFGGVQVRDASDIDALADRVAWRIQQGFAQLGGLS